MQLQGLHLGGWRLLILELVVFQPVKQTTFGDFSQAVQLHVRRDSLLEGCVRGLLQADQAVVVVDQYGVLPGQSLQTAQIGLADYPVVIRVVE